jgi:predicted small secreted protein
MKLGRFLIAVAAGAAVGYVLSTENQKTKRVKPEKVIQLVKNRYKNQMNIIGSWIHMEPKIETLNGIQYNIYQGGLTGMIDDSPQFLEFMADADTGTLLKVES